MTVLATSRYTGISDAQGRQTDRCRILDPVKRIGKIIEQVVLAICTYLVCKGIKCNTYIHSLGIPLNWLAKDSRLIVPHSMFPLFSP